MCLFLSCCLFSSGFSRQSLSGGLWVWFWFLKDAESSLLFELLATPELCRIEAWTPHDSKQKHIFAVHAQMANEALLPLQSILHIPLFFKSLWWGFFFCSDSHSNPLLSPALVKIDWQRCWVRGRERRMPEGRINGRSWFYFPVFEGRTDVYMKQCLQCDWQLSLVWPMSQVP